MATTNADTLVPSSLARKARYFRTLYLHATHRERQHLRLLRDDYNAKLDDASYVKRRHAWGIYKRYGYHDYQLDKHYQYYDSHQQVHHVVHNSFIRRPRRRPIDTIEDIRNRAKERKQLQRVRDKRESHPRAKHGAVCWTNAEMQQLKSATSHCVIRIWTAMTSMDRYDAKKNKYIISVCGHAARTWSSVAKSFPRRSASAVQKKWAAMKRQELEQAQSDKTIPKLYTLKYLSTIDGILNSSNMLKVRNDQLVHVRLPDEFWKSATSMDAQHSWTSPRKSPTAHESHEEASDAPNTTTTRTNNNGYVANDSRPTI